MKGLGGAQFALPDAVEWLRAVASEDQSSAGFVVMAASDPANVYNLPLELVERDPLSRPRGTGSLLVTRGGQGMTLMEGDTPPLHITAVGAQQPVDVTGAGDTVIATFALALASGASFADAARLANYAGGLVVMKRGTASVTAAASALAPIGSSPRSLISARWQRGRPPPW